MIKYDKYEYIYMSVKLNKTWEVRKTVDQDKGKTDFT